MDREKRDKIERVQNACKTNLKFLCKECFGMKDWSPVHDELASFLKTSGKRKLIELPRGHLKSSIVTKGWAIQRMLNDFNIRILIANATWDNSRKFLRSIQKYLGKGSSLEGVFGYFSSEHWNQDECTIWKREKVLDAPTFATTGLEKEQTSQHYDLIIADDLVARDNCMTSDQREKVKLYYNDLLDLLEPDGTLVIVGTTWHQDDLYSVIEKEPGWDFFKRTCFKDDARSIPTFPEKFSLDHLKSLRESKGSREFSAQYLLNPIDEENTDFRSSQIQFYEAGDVPPLSLYMTVDPAISLSRYADFSAGVVAGMSEDRRIFVVDYFKRKLVPNELIDQIFEMMEKWKLTRMGIESFAFQRTLKYSIFDEQRKRGKFFSIDEMGKSSVQTESRQFVLKKEARIRLLQPYFEQGLIYLRKDMSSLVDEIISFPHGKHDDILDALSYQREYLVPAGKKFESHSFAPGTFGALWKATLARNRGTMYEEFLKDLKEPVMPFSGW